MRNILAEIIEYKKEYIANSKEKISESDIIKKAMNSPVPRSFSESLKKKKCGLIAEIKKASPSKGIICEKFDYSDVAKIYENNGAACISVLTDEKYFKGNIEAINIVKQTVNIPVLRKDFIIDSYQIFEARAAGADAILLIAACLTKKMTDEFLKTAESLGMDCLVEVHNQRELDMIGTCDIKLLGINNRDLTNFKISIETTGNLAEKAPAGVLIVSESGIKNAEDVKKVYSMGARAVLVGGAIMESPDMALKVREISYAV